MSSTSDIERLRSLLDQHGQIHVLDHWDKLNSEQRDQLMRQLESIDLDQLDRLISVESQETDFASMAARATAPPGIRADGSGMPWSVEDARRRGEDALRQGQVGALIVAGGQGTRLGFDLPKGMFPIGPVSGRTLFQIFADRLIATNQKYGVRIPLYLMTSDATDGATRDYFEQHDYLGLPREDVMIFRQGTMPAVDAQTGKLLLAETDSLALSPDGHGGTVEALRRAGCLDDAADRGIKQLSYIQIDNPLAHLCEPTFIGHHLLADSELTTQVIRKRYPLERVGNVVSIDGSLAIIEYSDLPRSAAELTDPDGQLRLWAGNIAVHLFDVDFLRRVSQSVDALPFHRAKKKVPFVDTQGQRIEPSEANAIKFERFIFDLLPAAQNALVVEATPTEAFAPVKNADGAQTDTPSQAKAAISNLHRQWLEEAGVTVDEGVQVEINPRFALSAHDLKNKISGKNRISEDQYFES